MEFKVHWIVDGIAVCEAETAEQAEQMVQQRLQQWVLTDPSLIEELGAKAIQGKAYIPGSAEAKADLGEEE
ncbi:MAG: translation initiation factor IF-2 [Alphaproteobacteria bacterium]|jgi:hypothetical protein|nr:translation initiation factor IF-2 [Alphaproteobacteria bacterium]